VDPDEAAAAADVALDGGQLVVVEEARPGWIEVVGVVHR